METVNCDFCGGTKFENVTTQTDILHKSTSEYFTIVECTQCKLNFLNPRPSMGEIGKYYIGSYSFHQSVSKLKTLLSSLCDKIANSIFCYFFIVAPKNIQSVLSKRIRPKFQDPVLEGIKLTPGKKVLDIGCGSGISAHYWGPAGSIINYKKYADAYGVEVHPESRKILAENNIPSFANLDEIAAYCYNNKLTFDFIRMNWSLEHVHSPSLYFKFMSDFLNQDGTLIINIPNYDGFLYRIAKDLVEVPIHLFHFKLADIKNYASKFGLKVTSHQSFSYPAMLIHAGEVHPSFGQLSRLNLLECLSLKKFLTSLDQSGLGNDLILQLKKL